MPPERDDDLVALAERLHSGLRATEALIREVYEGREDVARDVAGALAEIRNLQENVRGLRRIVESGNGGSLLSRFAVMEAKLIGLESARQLQAGRMWQIVLLAIPGLISFLLYVLPLILRQQ